jgi:hypothetical protein
MNYFEKMKKNPEFITQFGSILVEVEDVNKAKRQKNCFSAQKPCTTDVDSPFVFKLLF